MAFGFPAYHSERFAATCSPHDLREAVSLALESLNWSIQEELPNRIRASTSANLWSWGEKITITFAAGNSLVVRSECSLPTQCFDWGKNRSNVSKFLEVVEERT